MVFWILAGIGAFFVNLYFAATFYVARVGIWKAMGPRDNVIVDGVYHQRARRSAENFKESLPIFLALGLLALIVDDADQATAVQGAQIFVLSRLAYIAAYVSGVPLLRTAVFGVSMAGLVLMALAVI